MSLQDKPNEKQTKSRFAAQDEADIVQSRAAIGTPVAWVPV